MADVIEPPDPLDNASDVVCNATPTSVEAVPELEAVAPASTGATHTNGYHFFGATTKNDGFKGIKGSIKVQDVSLAHDGRQDSFFAAWFMATETFNAGRFVQVGWAETDWKSGQKIFVWDTETRTWRFYGQFEVSPGSQPVVSLQHTNGVVDALIHTSNGWARLYRIDIQNESHMLEYGEVKIEKDGSESHPTIGSTQWGNNSNVRVKKSDDSWTRWTTDISTSRHPSPTHGGYEAHWLNGNYDWLLHRH